MEKKLSRRKLSRRKYKRYAAAVAGAALISGAALHGMPAAKAYASENPVPSPPVSVKQLSAADVERSSTHRDHGDRDRGDRDHGNWGNRLQKYHYRWFDRNYDDTYVSKDGSVVVRYFDSPVDTIKNQAAAYGFDAVRDTFTFLSLSSREASILVTKHDTGQRFTVDLVRDWRGSWRITAVR
ncbi:MAG: hypothetical protein AAGU23_04085 [Bacillota bacterium]